MRSSRREPDVAGGCDNAAAWDDTGVWEVAPPPLPSRIRGVTMAGFRDRRLGPAGHRLVPHPAVTLAIQFGEGRLLVDDARGRRHRGSLVAGVGLGLGSEGGLWVRGEGIECVQVRLSPMIARAVLGVGPSDLDGAVVALDDLWGAEAYRFGERLHELDSWEARFALTDALLVGRARQLLARRTRHRPYVDPEVAWTWRRIVRSGGLARVDRLADEVGWSRKRLWSRFREQVGLPPKRAASLVRFDHAVHRLVAGRDAASVALDSGYSDQSHLHREVVAFAGVTPAAITREPFLAVDDVAWPDRERP